MNFRKQIDKYKDDIIRDTQELIRIRSIRESGGDGMPFGAGMKQALDFVLDRARAMGFTVCSLDGYCGYIEYGESDSYIGIISHVDTCPEGEKWFVPPFEGLIRDNRIYGRGAMDNKGPLIAALYGLLAIKDTGRHLNKRIRYIIGTDEQRYYEDIKHYLMTEKPPIAGFTLDGQFPVVFAEKGLAMMEFRGDFPNEGPEQIVHIIGGTAENTVPEHCEALIRTDRGSAIIDSLVLFARENRHSMTAQAVDGGVRIESFGMPTHSMAIELGRNAISPLMQFLVQMNIGGPAVRQLVRHIDEKIGFDLYGKGFGVDCQDEFSGRLTLNLGTLSYIEGQAAVRLDLRYPVTCNFEEVAEKITGSFVENGFSMTENTYWDPIYFPKDHFLMQILLKAYREVMKDQREPIVSGSGSYAKAMPNIAAFGAIFPGESMAWHQVNEFIDIDHLVKMTEIYATAAYELSASL